MIERTPKDYAIEFGEYLAQAAERFIMAEMNCTAQSEIDPEYWSDLECAIYEFRKRAKRAKETTS